MTKITLDFETQSQADLRKLGAYEYSMHPSTKALCLAIKWPIVSNIVLIKYKDMQKHFNSLPGDFQAAWAALTLSTDYTLSAHNAFFEQCIYNNILVKRFGWPPIPMHKWRCTAAKAAIRGLPRSLQGAGEAMKLITQKDLTGYKAMMKLCKPTKAWNHWNKYQDKTLRLSFSKRIDKYIDLNEEPVKFWTPETAPEDFATLYRYCKIDALSEEELDTSLPDLIPLEQKIWFLDQKINMRGICVDRKAAQKISDIMTSESKRMGKELDTLTMGLVSSGQARNQVLEFLKLEGLELPDLKAKTVDEFLANGKINGDAKKLLELRKALSKSSTAKYTKFLKCSESDGRVRDLYLYCAAGTRRWGGKNLQPQNLPRGIIKDIYSAIEHIKNEDVEMLKLLYGENLMPLFSSVIRGMFIASPGKELFVQDFNAIETRVLWWLAGHEKGLNLFRKGIDPYAEMAADIFEKKIEDVTEDERQVGKAAVLGLGYQMGWKKFIAAAWDVYRVRVSPEIAKRAVTIYRKKHWPIPELWENYNNAAIEAVENPGKTIHVGRVSFLKKGSFLNFILPSGGSIAYKDPIVRTEPVTIYPDPVETIINGKVVLVEQKPFTFMSKRLKYWAVNSLSKKWEMEVTYGGKEVENVVQGVSRDLLAEAMLLAENKGFEVLMHSHDEIVAEATKGRFSDADYNKIMETLPAWAPGLPLKAKGWSGPRYRKG